MAIFKIVIVDDHALFRNGLKLLLSSFKDIDIVGEASNGKDLLDLLQHTEPDIVLMDINMPEMDGVEATRLALEQHPGLKIISLSMYGEEEYYYKMIDAGVKGFLLKNSDITDVKQAIETVAEGGNYFSEELLYSVVKNIRKVSFNENNNAGLSEREIEVLCQICKGLSNFEIADQLHISKRTVDKHRANLLEKTGSKNTANLVMYAIKHKLIEV
ncbi:MAG: response regulator transcription factor [Bacteroidota bacterium]|nr:response regulator transcription factor [Bacteroidota bacterium]MDP4273601.1 response regulator transcription factor [Bacteroidota bacterium]